MTPEWKQERLMNEPITIGVVGAIGAGKSTISTLIGEKFNIEVFEEHYKRNPYLKRFYDDPKKWSIHSQSWFLESKVAQLRNHSSDVSRIVDPCLEMDSIYAQTLHSIGFMSRHEFDLYQDLFNALQERYEIKKPDVFLHIDADTDILKQRIINRGRKYEKIMLKKYPFYLDRLREITAKQMSKKPNVISIDTTEIDCSNSRHVENLMKDLRTKINL